MQIRLRPYQSEAIDAFFENLSQFRRQLMVLPTGSGKTVVFSSLARRWYDTLHSSMNYNLASPMKHNLADKPILIMAHRSELLDQAEDKLHMVWPDVMCGRVQAERNEPLGQVIIASTPTLVAGRKIPQPSLVVFDEVHHAHSTGSMRVLQELGVFEPDGPVLLGVTATPTRADRKELGDLFEHITYERTILQMIMDGYLTNVRGKKVIVPNLELSHIRSTAGDYNARDLSIVLNRGEALNATVEAVVTHAKGMKTVVFAVDVEHAKALTERFKIAGYKAASIDGSMPKQERASVLADFEANRLQVLLNCQVLTEGWDCADLECVVLARPTRSQALYTQMVGRALRLHPGKEEALVLDLTGASDDKNLQTFSRLMQTQVNEARGSTKRSTTQSGKKADKEHPETPMVDSESVEEWLQRLAEIERNEQAEQDAFVQSINLFANRARFHWVKVNDNFSISYGDGQWAYLIVEGMRWWPVLQLPGEKYLPLHDSPLELEYAQGIVEGFLDLLESKVIDKDADWRTAPASQRQKYLLEKYRVAYDSTWTRGMASDVLNQKFAKRQLKKVVATFDPIRWREALDKPHLKEKHHRLVDSILASAQNQNQLA